MSDRVCRCRRYAVLAAAVTAIAVIATPSAAAADKAAAAAVPLTAGGPTTPPTLSMALSTALPTPPSTTPSMTRSSDPATEPSSMIAAVPRPDHVVVVVEENEDASAIIGSPAAPYLTQLAGQSASFTNAHAETHPSQPNYLALFSGDEQSVSDDSCVGPFSAPNLASELLAAGKSFVGYSEDLPQGGFTGCTAGKYAQKHSPWATFSNVPSASNQPWNAWPTDYTQLPAVAFVTPNLCNDMHDCGVAAGDGWLQANLAGYAGWAATHNSWLIVTWDEASDSSPGNTIATLISGAGVRPGQYNQKIDHYSLLRTLEDAYSVHPLGNAAVADPITGIWTPTPPDASTTTGIEAPATTSPATTPGPGVSLANP